MFHQTDSSFCVKGCLAWWFDRLLIWIPHKSLFDSSESCAKETISSFEAYQNVNTLILQLYTNRVLFFICIDSHLRSNKWTSKQIHSTSERGMSAELHPNCSLYPRMSSYSSVLTKFLTTRPQRNKQTPWPLVLKRTISTERPPLVGEFLCQLCG
jgi:hypothetical protein